MQFTKPNCDLILDGKKTQTRRVCHVNDKYEPLHVGGPAVIDTASIRNRWVVGQTYAVQPGRGKKAVGRIRITAIRRERLQDISETDVRAKG